MNKNLKHTAILMLLIAFLFQCNNEDGDNISPDDKISGEDNYLFSYNDKDAFTKEASLTITAEEGIVTYISTKNSVSEELEAFSFEENELKVIFEYNQTRDTAWVYLEESNGVIRDFCVRMFTNSNQDFVIQTVKIIEAERSYQIINQHITRRDFFENGSGQRTAAVSEDDIESELSEFPDVADGWFKDYTTLGKGKSVVDGIIAADDGTFAEELGESTDEILSRLDRALKIGERALKILKSKTVKVKSEVANSVFKYLQKKWWEFREMDCHGDIGGDAIYDNCNICVEGNTEESACEQDCNGDWGGDVVFDYCGTALELHAGNNQSGNINLVLPNPIEVSIKDLEGNPIENAIVNFMVSEGSVSVGKAYTNANGIASTKWTLGSTEDEQTLSVTAFESDGTTSVQGSPLSIYSTAYNFKTVTIGTQVWMAENLNITHYPNGTAIPLVEYSATWDDLGDNNTDDAYGYYNNQSTSQYGALYTYAAAKNACPTGWHLPSDGEWTILENYLAENGFNYDGSIGGGKAKIAKSLAAQSNWTKDTGTGTIGNNLSINNGSGFSALPGGYRSSSGGDRNADTYGNWWTSTESSSSTAFHRRLTFLYAGIGRFDDTKKSYGQSVRCVKD